MDENQILNELNMLKVEMPIKYRYGILWRYVVNKILNNKITSFPMDELITIYSASKDIAVKVDRGSDVDVELSKIVFSDLDHDEGTYKKKRNKTNQFIQNINERLQILSTEKKVKSLYSIGEDFKGRCLLVDGSPFILEEEKVMINNIIKETERRTSDKINDRLFVNLHTIPVNTKYFDLPSRRMHLEKLMGLLEDKSSPNIIAICSSGGYGKTALAVKAAYMAKSKGLFKSMFGMSAKKETFVQDRRVEVKDLTYISMSDFYGILSLYLHVSASKTDVDEKIRQRVNEELAGNNHFVLLDNFETAEETDAIIGTLKTIGGKSKFIITTRHDAEIEHGIESIRLQELDIDDRKLFLKKEIGVQPGKLFIKDRGIEKLAQVALGIPLLIKLCVGKLSYMQFDTVLEFFANPGEDVFRFLYEDTFHSLSPDALKLLEYIIEDSKGTRSIHYNQFSGLMETESLLPALRELVVRSLLEVSGDFEKRAYHFHSLLESYFNKYIGGK